SRQWSLLFLRLGRCSPWARRTLTRRRLGGGGRPHSCQNIRLIAKIFRSHLLNVIERQCVHIVFESLVIIEAESVQFVQGALITKSVVALIGDLLLPNQFLFRSR